MESNHYQKSWKPSINYEHLLMWMSYHQFLGITGFYRKFVPFYADITNYLTKLLRKGTKFQWSEQCNNAFNILKEELCKMPSLQYPYPNKPFKLFTDMSNHNYSGILHQAQDEEPAQLIPKAYFFRKFQPYTATLECHPKGMLHCV